MANSRCQFGSGVLQVSSARQRASTCADDPNESCNVTTLERKRDCLFASASLGESVLRRYCTRLVFEKFNICRLRTPGTHPPWNPPTLGPTHPGTHPPWGHPGTHPSLTRASLKVCAAQIAQFANQAVRHVCFFIKTNMSWCKKSSNK